MSENITHTAVVDDCLNFLLFQQEAFSPAFVKAAKEARDFAQLGGITRHGDRHNPQLLTVLRERYENGTDTDVDQQKLGFVIGWLSHRAADRQFKRIFRSVDPDCPRRPTDCSIYHDAYLFRHAYNHGQTAPYDEYILNKDQRGNQNAETMNVARVEKLLNASWIRMLIQTHTFIPDDTNVEEWLEKVCATRQRIYVDLARYAAAYETPDPELYKRFITDINFYDSNDQLLQIAEDLREERIPGGDLTKAAIQAREESQYAQALTRAYKYVCAASNYFKREIGMEELVDTLDIGKPELEKV